MSTFCFITMRAALFLSQIISAIKCCSGWELISFHLRLQLFPEESGVDGQNYVVVGVIVSDPHHILHLFSPPFKYSTLPTEVTFVWLIRFCVKIEKTKLKLSTVSLVTL